MISKNELTQMEINNKIIQKLYDNILQDILRKVDKNER